MRARVLVLLSALLTIAVSLAVLGSSKAARATPRLPKPAVPATGAYLGAYVDTTTSIDREPDVATFESETGRGLAIDNHYELWDDALIGEDQYEDAAYGRIPMISWRCPSGKAIDDAGGGDASIIAGLQDTYIIAQAKAVAAYGHPLFIRWFWEMDLDLAGNQECLGNLGPAGYIAAWQHIYHIFQQYGASNAAFVWNPSSNYAGSSSSEFYPGDQYVDWIAADGYAAPGATPTTPPKSFASVFQNFYAQWAPLNKPLMIGETGVGTLPDSDPKAVNPPIPPGTSPSEYADEYEAAQSVWVSQMMAALQTPAFKDIHAVLYYDTSNPRRDYILGSQALSAYKTAAASAYFQRYGTQIPISFTGTTTGSGTTGRTAALTVTASGFPVPRLTGSLPTGCSLVPTTAPGTSIKNLMGVASYTCDNACPSQQAATVTAASYYGTQATVPAQSDKENVALLLTGTPAEIDKPELTTNTVAVTQVSQQVGICSLKHATLSLSDSRTAESLPTGLSFAQDPFVSGSAESTGTVTYTAKDLVAGNTVLYLRAKISGGAAKIVCSHPGKPAPAPSYYCTVPLNVLSPGTVTTTDAVAATLGTDFTYTLKTDGNPTNAVYVIGAMPKWMHFVTYGNGTAEIFGIPTAVNVFTVKFATKGFTLPGSPDPKAPTTTYNLIVTVNQ